MDAFQSIGIRGSASLAVVAPGIAEALITTAAGLAAAVPAVIAYNYFLGRIDAIQRELDQFAVELAATVPIGVQP
jgi:biopolymer transport protein TolQ